MYHEEKVIDGVLHWRGTPRGEFTPYTAEQLTRKVMSLRLEMRALEREAANATA